MKRERTGSSGRTQEISRLIGRSLRSCVDLQKIKNLQITIDCDVLQADGGTRTAAITGGFVALAQALHYLEKKKEISKNPLKNQVSAVSVGILEGRSLLDLCYREDSMADTDCNFVINNHKELVEVQGTAEENSFTRNQLNEMLDLAIGGCENLHRIQSDTMKQLGLY